MSIKSYSFLFYCTEMFSTLQSGLADLCWLWSCCKVPRSFFCTAYVFWWPTGNKYWCIKHVWMMFLVYLHILWIWMCLIFYPLYEIRYDSINESHRIGCVDVHRRSSYERASVSVRWSWVTMCSQRRAEQRREEPCIRKISFPWTSLNPIENFTGIRTAARKVQESETF